MKVRLNHPTIALLIALPAIIYIHARAFILSFTFDEAWTFLGYAAEDFWEVINNTVPSANNHILHSVMMMISYDLFGIHEYTLRLPVLIAFCLYVFYAFKISELLALRIWWIPFILLIYQPYLLDYFVAARGYGLALAFMLGAIYFLAEYVGFGKQKWMWLSLVLAALSALSNFTYLLLFIAIVLCVLLISFFKKELLKGLLIVSAVSMLVTYLVYEPIIQLIDAKEFYYGGTTGFFEDTLVTLAQSFVYNLFDARALAWMFALIIAFSGVLALKFLLKRKIDSLGFWTVLLLIVIEFGSIIQHYIVGSPYLIDRTAIFFIPLLTITVCWLISQISNELISNVFSYLLVGLFLINFLAAANFTYLLDFKDYADVDQAMMDILEDGDIPEGSFRVGKSVYINGPMNFYRLKYGLERIDQLGMEYCEMDERTRYFYLFEKDLKCVENRSVDLMAYYPVSQSYLYKVK